MLPPNPASPLDQIRDTIKRFESEARHAREDADAALVRAEHAEATALAHEETAGQWRRILAREERAATEERIATVALVPDVEGYRAKMKRAAEAFREATAARNVAHGGIHMFAEPESTGEAYISRRPRGCVCKDGDRCSDCTDWPKGNTND